MLIAWEIFSMLLNLIKKWILKSLNLNFWLAWVFKKIIWKLTQYELVYLIGSKDTRIIDFNFKKLILNDEIKKQ